MTREPTAWPVVILAVRPGARSGWALFASGVPKMGDEIDSLDANAVRKVIRIAVGLANLLDLPCVLVLERPEGHWENVRGRVAARDRWRAAWCELVGTAGHVVDVEPRVYRTALVGARFEGSSGARERSIEVKAARAIVRPFVGWLGPAEAAAVCIGHWATRASALATAIGKRAAVGTPTEVRHGS